MKKKVITLLLIITSLTSLVGCNDSKDVKKINYAKNYITEDSKTVTYRMRDMQSNKEAIPEKEEVVLVAQELTINGDLNEVDWVIDEYGNVIYNGKTFTELSYNIDKLDLPCSKNSLIEFIVTNYNSNNTEIYTLVDFVNTNYNEVNEEVRTEVSTEVSTEETKNLSDYSNEETYNFMIEELQGVVDYDTLVNKYGSNINWVLTVFDYGMTNFSKIYGCDKFMMSPHLTEDIIINY